MSNLAESVKRHAEGRLPDDRAKWLYPRLLDDAKEADQEAQLARDRGKGSAAELLEMRAEQMRQAAELIRILSTEQFRQRETIKHYLHGRGDTASLRLVSSTWNGDIHETA